MKKRLNLALVLMATAVSLTLTSCGGGGGGGGGGAEAPSDSGSSVTTDGYAPNSIVKKFVTGMRNGYRVSWSFLDNGVLVMGDDSYASGAAASGKYTYTKLSANEAEFTFYEISKLGNCKNITGQVKLKFSGANGGTATMLSEKFTNSSGVEVSMPQRSFTFSMSNSN